MHDRDWFARHKRSMRLRQADPAENMSGGLVLVTQLPRGVHLRAVPAGVADAYQEKPATADDTACRSIAAALEAQRKPHDQTERSWNGGRRRPPA